MFINGSRDFESYDSMKIGAMELNGNRENNCNVYLQTEKRNTNFSNELQIADEIEHYEIKLQQYRKEYEQVEKEIYDVSQLKDKGLFVLKNAQARNEDLRQDLKEIHQSYTKCMTKINRDGKDMMSKQINDLTIQRNNSEQELLELKKIAEQNNKKLLEMKSMITIQEKKNIALLRKLKRNVECSNFTEHSKRRINALLSDPRITKANVYNENVK